MSNTNLIRRLVFSLICIVACHSSAVAQELKATQNKNLSKFDFSVEFCSYQGYFDSTIYSRSQIRSCIRLLNEAQTWIIRSSVFTLKEKERVDLYGLWRDYKDQYTELMALDLPQNGNWQSLRDSAILNLKQSYRKQRIYYMALKHDKYELLDRFWARDSTIDRYRKGLQGNWEELQALHEDHTRKKAALNANPKRIWQKFKEQRYSDDWIPLTQIELMTYGWYNAANKYIDYFEGYQHMDELKSLFVKLEEECEEGC